MSKTTTNLEDLSTQVRELSYSLKSLAYLFEHTDPENPPHFDEIEGIACLLKNFSERSYQIAWQMDDHWIALSKK